MCWKTHRGWRNSACGVDPVDLVRDVTADLLNVHPRDILGRISIRCIRPGPSDEHCILYPLELWIRTEVPDGGNPSGGVADEIVLSEDQVRGNDFGEDIDQLLDRDVSGTRAVPEAEQVIVDSRYEPTVGARKAGDVENLGDGASSTVISISLDGSHSHAKRTRTQTRCWWNKCSSEHQRRAPRQREE